MASTPYKHFVPPVPLNPDYEKDLKCILIESLDQLKESFKNGYVIAWDTETTGLNPTESEIVGFSYTYDGITGYYCPVKHFDIALGKPALDLFYQALKDSKLQLLYNARFDIRMMEYSGYDMSFLYPKDPKTKSSEAKFIDVMNQVWLSDTNIPLPSLKSSTLHFLGYQPPKFLETLGDEQNFQYVPAKDAYRYACFTEDTLIQTKHGLKQIRDLKIGDLITTSIGYRHLLAVLPQGKHNVVKVTTPYDTSFTCTRDHRFSFKIGDSIFWVQAKDLDKIPFYFFYRGGESLNNINDVFNPEESFTFTGDTCTIEDFGEEREVYDLTIEEEHNFILQCGLIAHNCLDAINTYNLFKVTYKYFKESGLSAKMDNQCVYIIGQLEKQPLNINTEYLIELRDKVYNRVLELEQEIYSLAGHRFKIGSNRELTQVFLEQGIDTGERTKAGDMKTGIELLNLYLLNHPDCKLLGCLIEYKEQFKFYNSYLKTLVDIAKNQETVPPRFSYKLQSVPCLTENNLVLVKDKGIVHIPVVKENDLIWTQYGYKRVLWCNSHKSSDIYRVIFDNALFIEGTAHHPVLVNKGTELDVKLEWATLESLKEGEKVVFNHHTPTMQYSDSPNEEDYSEYLEYLGFLSSPYIEPSCKDLFDYKETIKELSHNPSKSLRDLTNLLTKGLVNLLDLVIGSKPYQWIRFLQGLFYGVFATDVGKRWNTHPIERFIIRSKQPIVLTFVMNLLYYLGIPNNLCYDEYSYYLELSSTQSLTLFNLLIVNDSESEYLKDFFKYFNPSGYYIEYADSKVKQIERLDGEYTVYDIEVEDVHEYVANGVVTHNTGRLATGKDGKNTYFAPINLQCLEENTSIKTDRGNIPIKNITNEDLVWTGNKFTSCKQLGSKVKEVYLVKTLWGEIEASLEHNFLTINPSNWNIEWHSLNDCIINHYPLLRDPQSLGSSFDDIYSYKYLKNKKDLDSDVYWYYLEYYYNTKFDVIQDVLCQGEKPVYDLFVPDYNQFTANGYIVHNSLPKPHSIKCYARKATQEEIDNKQDVLGWMFSPDHPEWSPGKVVEGMDQNLNVRAAFLPQHPEDGDYVISCDMCLEGGSPVQTKRGYVGISELKVGDFVLSPNGWVKVIRVKQTGIKKLIKVYPDNGGQVVYCSEDHPFIINGERVVAKNVREPVPYHPFYSYNSIFDRNNLFQECTPTSSYLLGFIYGDGNISERRNGYLTLNISSKDLQHLRRVGELFGQDTKIRHNTKDENEWFTLDIPNTELCETLMSLGVKKWKSYAGCDLPIGWLGDNIRHFIRGLLDSNGNVRRSSPSYLDLVLSLHDSYIKNLYDMFPDKWEYKSEDSLSFLRLDGTKEDKKSIYSYLYEGATIWLQSKRDIIDEWYKDNFGDISFPVWDITVDSEDHLYYVNGMLTHNCGEELRIVTNLFKEDSWARVINTGGDLHYANAVALFGKENYTKELRKRAKACISLDSYVHTSTGKKQIKDLSTSREVGVSEPIDIYIYTPEGYKKAVYFIYNGVRDTRILIFKDGTILEATLDHIVQSRGKLKEVGSLKVGDVVDSVNKTFKEIVKIVDSKTEVADITVDNKSHLFYANGLVVHNCAFGMLYGQEYRGFQRKFPEMSLDEAKEFMMRFKRNIPHIVHGQERMIKEAQRTGTFYTSFSRPRRVKHYLTSTDYKDIAFGKRTIMNSPIQGTAADVLKLELIRLWDNLFTEYPDFKWIVSIHDEIDVSVPRRLAYEVIPKMIRCMTVKLPDWPVTLDCSLSAGPTLGQQYEMRYNFETKEFEPKWEEETKKEVKVEDNEESLEESGEEINDEDFLGEVKEESIEEIDSKMFDF